jgi:hypothetical protein
MRKILVIADARLKNLAQEKIVMTSLTLRKRKNTIATASTS